MQSDGQVSHLYAESVLHELLQLTKQLTKAAAVVVGSWVRQLQRRNDRIQSAEVCLALWSWQAEAATRQVHGADELGGGMRVKIPVAPGGGGGLSRRDDRRWAA